MSNVAGNMSGAQQIQQQQAMQQEVMQTTQASNELTKDFNLQMAALETDSAINKRMSRVLESMAQKMQS